MRSEEHRKVEAVLFALGRDVAVEDVAGLCGLGQEQVLVILNELRQEYSSNQENALMLHEKGKFWKFSVKDRYLPLVTSLVENTELDKSTMETLAVIAWKYPIIQSDLIKIRNNKAYDHLKALEEREFIAKERFGRTYKIKLSPKFFEYFDLPTQDAKEAFRKVFPKEVQEQVEKAEKDIEAKEKEVEESEKKKGEEKPVVEKNVDEAAKEAAARVDGEEEPHESEMTSASGGEKQDVGDEKENHEPSQ